MSLRFSAAFPRCSRFQFADVFDRIVAYATGTPIHVVNPDVLGRAGR